MNIPILVGKQRLEDLIEDLEFGFEIKESGLKYFPIPNYLGTLCHHHGLTVQQMQYNWYAYQLIRESKK